MTDVPDITPAASAGERVRRDSAGRDGLAGRDLTIGYRAGPVVHGADVRIESGTVTALVGPNGSGKSTLLRALARLHPATSGRITLSAAAHRAGGEADALALTRREFACRVALLTQQRPTPDGVTVRDLVGYGRNPHQSRFRKNDPEGPAVVARSMAATGVDEIADSRIDELSGGQVQRVWLASCLAQDTGVLLLDEPTNHLDLRYQAEMLDLLAELSGAGIAVGVVLHDLNHAAEIADTVVLLHHGSVFAAGTPRQVLTAEILSEVYQVPVSVHTDPVTGVLTTRPQGRRHRAAVPMRDSGCRSTA